ncbi:MAG: hypothetical protein GF411_09680 [Candidatus Lokiarchaeota archaeon]|nr:hypothetical protein [Candidatus Lokiarchaeota archaeon]
MIEEKVSYVCKESLIAMKSSLENSYSFDMSIFDQDDFLKIWDYQANDGRRRLKDITEVIDIAIQQLNYCDSKTASKIYLDTLKCVALVQKWTRILERASISS